MDQTFGSFVREKRMARGLSLTALPPKAPVQKAMPGSTLVDPRPQRRTAPQNAWRMPSRGSRPRTPTCTLRQKRRPLARH